MRAFIFAALCLPVACAHAHARRQSRPTQMQPSQPQQQEWSGVFTTYAGGRALAVESYRIARGADGRPARAEAEVGAEGGPKQRLVTAADGARPVSFTAEANGARVYEAEFGAGVVKVRAAGQAERELKTRATVVLENMVWHQFHFLLAQYDRARGGRQTFHFFAPSNGRDFEVTVERTGARSYDAGGRAAAAEHFRFEAAGNVIEMWADEAGGPLLFLLAAHHVRAVRRGAEQFAEQLAASAAKAPEWRPPPYAVASKFTEREVTVGEGTEWPLPGTLTSPAGRGPHPAVVLVHGSGPNDRDETLGASKPFRDLAWGLASQGVAVLRYEKRTRAHTAKLAALKSVTVKEETVDDAAAAAELLRRTPGIDPRRVFVLGHSLGGGLVPRIAGSAPGVRGFVILAGYTRPLLDELARQYEYIFSLEDGVSEGERTLLEAARRDAARVRELKPEDAAAGVTLQGVPAAYWLDLRDYSPPAAARRLRRPLLVLQGERDYNVTMDAFRDWQRALAGRRNVTFKSYPKLDHLFLEGEGRASPSDYAAPRHVAPYVVADIADWIKRH